MGGLTPGGLVDGGAAAYGPVGLVRGPDSHGTSWVRTVPPLSWEGGTERAGR